MSLGASAVQAEGNQVHANGIDIHYVEAGEGEPLILLHGGVVSTNLIWEGVPIAYASHIEALAKHFRVIAPDTRGGGRTAHSGSEEVTFDLLADDVVALIDALGLERPLITGFSEGAITATIVAIRQPRRDPRGRQQRRPRRVQPERAQHGDVPDDARRQPGRDRGRPRRGRGILRAV